MTFGQVEIWRKFAMSEGELPLVTPIATAETDTRKGEREERREGGRLEKAAGTTKKNFALLPRFGSIKRAL